MSCGYRSALPTSPSLRCASCRLLRPGIFPTHPPCSSAGPTVAALLRVTRCALRRPSASGTLAYGAAHSSRGRWRPVGGLRFTMSEEIFRSLRWKTTSSSLVIGTADGEFHTAFREPPTPPQPSAPLHSPTPTRLRAGTWSRDRRGGHGIRRGGLRRGGVVAGARQGHGEGHRHKNCGADDQRHARGGREQGARLRYAWHDREAKRSPIRKPQPRVTTR